MTPDTDWSDLAPGEGPFDELDADEKRYEAEYEARIRVHILAAFTARELQMLLDGLRDLNITTAPGDRTYADLKHKLESARDHRRGHSEPACYKCGMGLKDGSETFLGRDDISTG